MSGMFGATSGMFGATSGMFGATSGNWQYRRYMTDNATAIMQKNVLEACNEQGAYPNVFEYRIGQPYLYRTCRERTTPVGYEHSDLKAAYLNQMRNSST